MIYTWYIMFLFYRSLHVDYLSIDDVMQPVVFVCYIAFDVMLWNLFAL